KPSLGRPRDTIQSGMKAVGPTVNIMSGQKVDPAALAQRNDRSATQSENPGDAVTARAETDRRLGAAEACAVRVSCHAQIVRFWVPGLVGLARCGAGRRCFPGRV